MNLNEAMVLGAGQAGQALFQQFGDTAGTSIFGGDSGNARYDSLVLSLQREVMNFTNTPHLGNPGGNRSNLF